MGKYFKLTDEVVNSTGHVGGWNRVMCQLRNAIREGREENKFEKVSNELGHSRESHRYAHPFFVGKNSEGYRDETTHRKSWWYKHHQVEPYNELLEGAEEF